jgi:hypothetical protein
MACASVTCYSVLPGAQRGRLIFNHRLPFANPRVRGRLPGPLPVLDRPDHLQCGEESAVIEPEAPAQVVSVLRFWHSAKYTQLIFQKLIGLRSLRIPAEIPFAAFIELLGVPH